MKTIYRFTVPIDDQLHELPLHWLAPIVHAGFSSHPYRPGEAAVDFWAVVDPDAETGTFRRCFTVVGTGHPIPAGFHHRGTYVDPVLPLVWHLLEADFEEPF